jgi:hypothetical protein
VPPGQTLGLVGGPVRSLPPTSTIGARLAAPGNDPLRAPAAPASPGRSPQYSAMTVSTSAQSISRAARALDPHCQQSSGSVARGAWSPAPIS